MKSAAGQITQPAPTNQAPAVIHLPPPADMPPAPTRHGSDKRRRSRLGVFRYDDAEFAELERRARDAGLSVSAYGRQATIGADAAPPRRRPRRIATVETEALMTALVAFNRDNNNLNQLARTGNTLALFAEEYGCERLADLAGDLVRAVEDLRGDMAPALAAILAAVGHDPEG
jgi:mobilization protein NikA